MKCKHGWLSYNRAVLIAFTGCISFFASCTDAKKKNRFGDLRYENFKASLLQNNQPTAADTSNVFDSPGFVPAEDSATILLRRMDSLWKEELVEMTVEKPADKKMENELKLESAIVSFNMKSLREFFNNKDSSANAACIEKECPLLVEVVKSKQLLYLYIEGEMKDSFKVSTGIESRETPNMNLRASGPVFMKYTSKKFPGGNYNGLGNMPYAVFIKGGYAIHGTTQGNFSKLGTKASHGCIRLHPNDAKLFYELVNMVGLPNTWVIVRYISSSIT